MRMNRYFEKLLNVFLAFVIMIGIPYMVVFFGGGNEGWLNLAWSWIPALGFIAYMEN
jgi:hypothetical protein